MSIEAQAKKIMRNAIDKAAKKHDVSCKEVQLLMKMNDGMPKFYITKQFKIVREISVKELYPVLIDVFHVRQLLPAFVGSLLTETAEKCEAENWEDVKIFIFTMEENTKNLHLYAYNKNKKYKALDWEEVFGMEAMARLMVKQG